VDSFPWDAFRGLADAGQFGLPFEAKYGTGLEFPVLGTCTVTEEIAYHSASMAACTTGSAFWCPKPRASRPKKYGRDWCRHSFPARKPFAVQPQSPTRAVTCRLKRSRPSRTRPSGIPGERPQALDHQQRGCVLGGGAVPQWGPDEHADDRSAQFPRYPDRCPRSQNWGIAASSPPASCSRMCSCRARICSATPARDYRLRCRARPAAGSGSGPPVWVSRRPRSTSP